MIVSLNGKGEIPENGRIAKPLLGLMEQRKTSNGLQIFHKIRV